MKSLHPEDLSLAVIQQDIAWENKEENLSMFTKSIQQIKSEHPVVDLMVLPEMFTTGFTMQPYPVAETMSGATVAWMKEISVETEAAICGSIIIEENGSFFNRFILVKPNQEIGYYDKKHLFAYAGEDKMFTPGKSKVKFEYKGWNIQPFICYDLRFPVWCRNTELNDIMIFVANWPSTRIGHWNCLLPARAIENQCYVIGVNRVGTDLNQLNYNGQSAVYDPSGQCILALKDQSGFEIVHLEKSKIEAVRSQTPFWKDADRFTL